MTPKKDNTDTHDAPKECSDIECIKRFRLPVEVLDEEFEISALDLEHPFFLREIRRCIVEKLDDFAKVVRAVLEPDTTLNDLHESRHFLPEQKEELVKLYKMLMVISKDAQLLEIDSTDKKEAEFIKHILGAYPQIKTRMADLVEKTREAWTKEDEVKKDLGYLG